MDEHGTVQSSTTVDLWRCMCGGFGRGGYPALRAHYETADHRLWADIEARRDRIVAAAPEMLELLRTLYCPRCQPDPILGPRHKSDCPIALLLARIDGKEDGGG